MSFRPTVLIYGHDPDLLETRRWVLEKTGYNVVTAADLADVSRLEPFKPVDLFVLCHTLTLEECGRALAIACTRWPNVQSLVLTAGSRGCFAVHSDKFFDTSAGPAMLVKTVSSLVPQAQHFS